MFKWIIKAFDAICEGQAQKGRWVSDYYKKHGHMPPGVY